MYAPGQRANRHHSATYGDPADWPYHHFIDGADDLAGRHVQFAPKLTSAGGNVSSGAVAKQWSWGTSTNLLWTFTEV